jgi:hypothetical protein
MESFTRPMGNASMPAPRVAPRSARTPGTTNVIGAAMLYPRHCNPPGSTAARDQSALERAQQGSSGITRLHAFELVDSRERNA